MGKSIKDYTVRISMKGKTRGRPSNFERHTSKIMSDYMDRPDVKDAVQKSMDDLLMFGTGIVKLPSV